MRIVYASRDVEPTIVEPFIVGEAVGIVGDQAWQIRLAGDSWFKSIHHADLALAGFMPWARANDERSG